MNGGDDPPATLDVSDEQTHRPPGVPVAEYESWGEESMIYLARVVVQFDGIMMREYRIHPPPAVARSNLPRRPGSRGPQSSILPRAPCRSNAVHSDAANGR